MARRRAPLVPKSKYSIWKYELKIDDKPQEVEMPFGASTALTVQFHHGRLVVWCIIEPAVTKRVKRVFQICSTGQDMPDEWNHYIGTVQQHAGNMVYHVFQLTDYLTEEEPSG